MYRLYGMSGSGNCYKPRLLLAQLNVEFEWVEKDILKGETHFTEYLAMNANGKVPLLEIEPGQYLAESNAILWYLAENTPYLSGDRWLRAQALQWLFFEQYSHEPYLAVARFIRKYLPPDHARYAELPRLHQQGQQALGVMDRHLERHVFFAGEQYSIADIALYAYTHVAEEGGFDLSPFAAIRGWLERVRAQPRHLAMT